MNFSFFSLSLASKHSCPYCIQVFSTPSGVKRHIIYRHTDIKCFQCPDCSLSFKCADSLTVHRRRLHLHERNQEEKSHSNENTQVNLTRQIEHLFD